MAEKLATVLPSTFETEMALRPLLRLVEQFPDNPHAWRYLGHAYWYGGHEVEAEAAFAEMVKREPDSAMSHFIQGCLAHIKGDDERALAFFQQAEQGELVQADRLLLYKYRVIIYTCQGQAELAEQDKQRYDQLYGQPYFYDISNSNDYKKHHSDIFINQVKQNIELGKRVPRILIVENHEPLALISWRYLKASGYIVQHVTLADESPLDIQNPSFLVNYMLMWQPDLILYCLNNTASAQDPYLLPLLYQVRRRGRSTKFPIHVVYGGQPPLWQPYLGIIECHFPQVTIRDLLQSIERILQLQASPTANLVKRDWSRPTLSPHELIFDIETSVYIGKHLRVFILNFTITPGQKLGNSGTAILVDGRRVPVKLDNDLVITGKPFPPDCWHGYAYLDLPDPENAVILSVIVPAPKK